MGPDFSTLYNHNEQRVFAAVREAAPGYPAFADEPQLLADVACVALNRLPARYIRHSVDLAFYQTDRERAVAERQLKDAVTHAFEFVQARRAMLARA